MAALLVVALHGTAAAQARPASAEPSAADLAEARRTFQVGLAHADRGEWQDAAVSFRQVLEVREAPPVFYNLGAALVALDQFPEAEQHLRRVVDDPSADPALVERARAALATIAARGGRVTFVVSSDAPTTVVYVDGTVLSHQQLAGEVPLVAGAHELVVRERGVETARRPFTVVAGQSLRVESNPAPVPAPAEVAVAASETPPSTVVAAQAEPTRGPSPERRRRLLRNPWLWTGVGAGVVLIVVVSAVAGGTSDPVQGNFDPPLVRF